MFVGWMLVSLRLAGVNSLKEKRHLLRGTLERLGRETGIAIAEVGDQDLWGNAEIGVSTVGNSVVHLEQVLQRVEELLAGEPRWEVVSVERGLEPVT